MSEQTNDVLGRARHLASECRYLARELAERKKKGLPVGRSGWAAVFSTKDPALKAYEKLLQEWDRKRAALRIAIDELLNAYCEELRASPWHVGAVNSRDMELTETRSAIAPQLRLIGRMRELRRSICNAGDHPLRGQWNPFVSPEYTIALDWGRVCYDLSRVADEAVDAGLPDLRPRLQRGVYLPAKDPNASRIGNWFDRSGQTMRWTMDGGVGAITLTIPGVLSSIDQWLNDAEISLADQGYADAKEDRQELDDRIFAAAQAKLPDDLKQWLTD